MCTLEDWPRLYSNHCTLIYIENIDSRGNDGHWERYVRYVGSAHDSKTKDKVLAAGQVRPIPLRTVIILYPSCFSSGQLASALFNSSFPVSNCNHRFTELARLLLI